MRSFTQGLLAVDLGAESGRAVIGRFNGDRLVIDDLHRFPNEPVSLPDGLHWDTPRHFREICHSINLAAGIGSEVAGIGVDTWGVDYGLIDKTGALIGLPFHYRDSRTNGMVDRAFGLVNKSRLYAETGCQTLPLNTAFQLLASLDSPQMEIADRLLMLPDLLNYWLTGETGTELTIASTSQLYNPVTGDWAWNAIQGLRIPCRLFGSIESAGTIRGGLRQNLSGYLGDVPVIAVASHDTASAFAAVTTGPTSLVISCGTWSLIGIETTSPILTNEALNANFTNEAGIEGTTRFLRNVAGLWLVQECRRFWASNGEAFSYSDLTSMAYQAPAFQAVIDLDDPQFLAPGNMPQRLSDYLAATGQESGPPKASLVRSLFESLALKYRWMVDLTESVVPMKIEALHIIGGGSRNELLCQFAADATGLPVFAGPVEATAIGNVMTQAMALGSVGSLSEIRSVIQRSFPLKKFEPEASRGMWDSQYGRMLALGSPKTDEPAR